MTPTDSSCPTASPSTASLDCASSPGPEDTRTVPQSPSSIRRPRQESSPTARQVSSPSSFSFPSSLQCSLATISLFLLLSTLPQGTEGATYYCYSCMSEVYGQLWDKAGYSSLYMQPKRGSMKAVSFTDHCAEPGLKPKNVGKIACSTNCISLRESLKLGFGAYGHIRGCYDSIFLWGFNKSNNAMRLAYREFCGKYNLSYLIAGHKNGAFFDTEMLACSCRGDLCNSAAHAARINSAPHSLTLLVLLPLLTSFLLTLYQHRHPTP